MLIKDSCLLTESLLGTDGHGVSILNGGLISENNVVADGPKERQRGNRLVTHLQNTQRLLVTLEFAKSVETKCETVKPSFL